VLKKLPERRLIFIHGPEQQGLLALDRYIERSDLSKSAIFRPDTAQSAHAVLGKDYALVAINAYREFSPDKIGLLSGTVMAGGALLIICPSPAQWPQFADTDHHSQYITRWIRLIQDMKGIECLSPESAAALPPIHTVALQSRLDIPATVDQQTAIDTVFKAARARRRQPAVITADRGRGKSAALGLAAAQLVQSGACRNILLTGAGLGSLHAVFKHARAGLTNARLESGERCLRHANGTLQYIATDRLLAEQPDCDLLLVDEAASLGLPRLTKLLNNYPRLVFSSTEHGYEGSGRGFALKFKQTLKQHSRGTYPASLITPVRWQENDPLERWTNQLLLLQDKADALGDQVELPALESLHFEPLGQQQLAEDEDLLRQAFSLLVDAHYQTRPDDLRQLLDAPNSQLWAARQGEHIFGLLWLLEEGGLSTDLAREIASGRRRPQGHLAPQILAAHLGLEEAVKLRCARIQRVVVRPDNQGRGLGSWMLAQLPSMLDSRVDYLASSFGADPPLSRFWRHAGYRAVRLSDRVATASGLYSALVIRPLSDRAQTMVKQAQDIFQSQFIRQLSSSLRGAPTRLLLALTHLNRAETKLEAQEIRAAFLFAYTRRPFESTLSTLALLAQQLLFDPAAQTLMSEADCQLYIARCLQYQSWQHCAEYTGLNGKQAMLESLRLSTRMLLKRYAEQSLLASLHEQYQLHS